MLCCCCRRLATVWRLSTVRCMSSMSGVKCSYLRVVPGLTKPLDSTQTSLVLCDRDVDVSVGNTVHGKPYCEQHEPRFLLKERLQFIRDQVDQSTKQLGKTTKKADIVRQRSLRLLATVQYWQSEYLQSIDFTDTPEQRDKLEETSLRVWRMICEIESTHNLADVEDKMVKVLEQVADFYQGVCDLVGIQAATEKDEGAEEISSDAL